MIPNKIKAPSKFVEVHQFPISLLLNVFHEEYEEDKICI
jgi:hypothetical protein